MLTRYLTISERQEYLSSLDIPQFKFLDKETEAHWDSRVTAERTHYWTIVTQWLKREKDETEEDADVRTSEGVMLFESELGEILNPTKFSSASKFPSQPSPASRCESLRNDLATYFESRNSEDECKNNHAVSELKTLRAEADFGTMKAQLIREDLAKAWANGEWAKVGDARKGYTCQQTVGKRCNGVDRPVARLEVAGDLGAGASGSGLDAAFGRSEEAITSTSVWAIRQTFEVCVVSGGRGLLEAASSVTIAFDLDVPFWQDAEEAQLVDESTATWGDAATLVDCVSHDRCDCCICKASRRDSSWYRSSCRLGASEAKTN
jgi:hypothetical protein